MAGKFASRITCPMAGASTSEAFGTSFQLCQMLDTILYTELCPENVLTFAFAFVLAFETLGLPLAKASGHVTYIELMGSFCKAIKPISWSFIMATVRRSRQLQCHHLRRSPTQWTVQIHLGGQCTHVHRSVLRTHLLRDVPLAHARSPHIGFCPMGCAVVSIPVLCGPLNCPFIWG